MVRIRMQRGGRRHVNYFRINAIEKRVKRDGKVLENLGWYNPQAKDKAKQVSLDAERIKHWLSQGAQPSDTVLHLLIKADIVPGKEWQDRLAARIEAVKAAEAMRAANPQPDPKAKKPAAEGEAKVPKAEKPAKKEEAKEEKKA